MEVMDTGFVKITIARHAETTQVLLTRNSPPAAFIMSLSDDEVGELINKLAMERYRF